MTENYSDTNETPIMPEAEVHTLRNELALQTMKQFQEKFPRTAKTFGIEGRPDSFFTVVQMPVRAESTVKSVLGGEIPITTYSHLLATPRGFRVLEFREYTGYGSYEQSEKAFQETLSTDKFQLPDTGSGLGHPSLKNPPNYMVNGNGPEQIMFGARGPFRPNVVTLGEDSSFIVFKKPSPEELKNLIDDAKEKEGIRDYQEDTGSAQEDIELMNLAGL